MKTIDKSMIAVCVVVCLETFIAVKVILLYCSNKTALNLGKAVAEDRYLGTQETIYIKQRAEDRIGITVSQF